MGGQGGREDGVGDLELGLSLPPGGLPEAVAVLDEEVDEGGGEAGLDDEGAAAAGGGLEVGDEAGDAGDPRLLPWEGHDPPLL